MIPSLAEVVKTIVLTLVVLGVSAGCAFTLVAFVHFWPRD